MKKGNALLGIALGVSIAVVLLATSVCFANGRGDGPIAYVRSQGLYYDSIVTADPLPPQGRFQLLEMGPHGLETEYGPGDQQYVGGRWMEDFDGDGEFHYFSCPLLGPGRESP